MKIVTRCFRWSNFPSQRLHSKKMTLPWIFLRWYFRSIFDAYFLSHRSQANFFKPSWTTRTCRFRWPSCYYVFKLLSNESNRQTLISDPFLFKSNFGHEAMFRNDYSCFKRMFQKQKTVLIAPIVILTSLLPD